MGQHTGTTSESFIRATGQGWKMAVGVLLFTIALVAAAIFHLGPEQARSPARVVEAVAGLLACAAVWRIRCPACRRSVGLWSFKHPVRQIGPGDTPAVRQCPYCAFPRSGDPSQSR